MAYCSVVDVKNYLGITESTDDVLIADKVEAAQAAIDAYTHRTFEASADSTRYFDAVGRHIMGRTLYLDADLCSITTVTNGDDVVISSSEYTTRPKNETPYYAIKILGSSGKLWTYADDYEDAISITGRWAWSTTAPDDIKDACVRWASYKYRQKDAQMYDVTAIEAGVVVRPFGVPPDIQAMLAPYVKHL